LKLKAAADKARFEADDVLMLWAKINYVKQVGNTVTASISGLPLSPQYKAGQMLKLKSEDGGGILGQGLISSIQHHLAVGDKSVEASTNINLSYVTFPSE
jgi:hypothetical protein